MLGAHELRSAKIDQICELKQLFLILPDCLNLPRVQRALSQQGNEILYPNGSHHVPPPAPIRHKRNDSSSRRNSRSIGSRRRSSGGSGKPYPTTSRRCSEAVATYAATGDMEAAAAILRGDKVDIFTVTEPKSWILF